jgi:hypothetical protein
MRVMARSQKRHYKHPFEEGKILHTTPQGFRKILSSRKAVGNNKSYAQQARETGLFDNPRWMDTLIVSKPAAQAQTSTSGTGQQAGTRRRKTTGHRKTRAVTGQQAQTGGSIGGRQNRLNYREMTNQQLISCYRDSGQEIQRRRQEFNSLTEAIGGNQATQHTGQTEKYMTA